MVSARWEQIKDVFDAAADLDEQRQGEFVSNACGGDRDLEIEILELLVADRNSDAFLKTPVMNLDLLVSTPAIEEVLPLHHVLCDRFEILSFLGEGGMGQVYEVLDRELRQHIAIKAIRRDIADNPGVLARFKREVYATRKVNHPNVCRTFDLEKHTPEYAQEGDHEPITFLTMELLRGETLQQRMHRDGPLPLTEVHSIAIQMAEALLAAHTGGIVHCDLKPANIFLTSPDDGDRAVITDFGIAKFTLPQDQTRPSQPAGANGLAEQAAGTPAYMAPEQFERGHCSPGSDLYSYGFVLFEALTGQRLSSRNWTLEDIRKKLKEAGVGGKADPTSADPDLGVVICGCLRIDVNERFSSAQQILQLLNSHRANRRLSLPVWLSGAAIVLAFLGTATWYGLRPDRIKAPSGVPSVAVLPFMPANGELNLTGMSDGVTTSLTNDLARVTGLSVPSQSFVRSLGKDLTPSSAGRSLAVDTAVTGSLTRSADNIHLQIELVDAHTGAQLWGESYNRKEGEMDKLARDVSQEIAFRLRLKADKSPADRLARQHSTNPLAESSYKSGQEATAERTPAGFERAVNFFQQSIDADPKFATAQAALANCYILMAFNYNRPEATMALLSKAESSANRALELDSTSTVAYTTLAQVETLRDYDWDAAERNYKRALELDPTYLPAHTSYGFHLLSALGRFAEARAEFAYSDRAGNRSVATQAGEALSSYFGGKYAKSVNEALKLKQNFPMYPVSDEILSQIYIAQGEPEKAIALLSRSVPLSEDSKLAKDAMLGTAYARVGRKHKAAKLLQQLESSQTARSGLNYQVAVLCAALQENDKAFVYLQKAYLYRQTSLLFINVDQLLSSLKSDVRFKGLQTKMNLR